jgi:hypothetical protein
MGVIKDALIGLLYRIISSPFSLLFTFFVAHSLSHTSVETFGEWQVYYTIFSSFLTVPADMVSFISTRYTAEGKPVGGVLILQAILGTIATIISVLMKMEIMAPMIISYYFFRSIMAITQGSKPIVVNISGIAFQLGRLLTAVILMLFFQLSIFGAVMAYVIGYICQSIFSITSINANLKIDIKITLKILKNSIAVIFERLQYIIEGFLVIFLFLYSGFTAVAYYEAAFVVASVVSIASASGVGIIRNAILDKEREKINDLIKIIIGVTGGVSLGTVTGAFFLMNLIREIYLSVLPAVYLFIVSLSLRIIYSALYSYLIALDKALSIEISSPLKSTTTKVLIKNMLFSSISIIFTILFIIIYHPLNIIELVMIATLPLIPTSIFMLISVYNALRKIIDFKLPKKESLVVSLSSASIGTLSILFLDYPSIITPLIAISLYLFILYLFNNFYRKIINLIILRILYIFYKNKKL